MKKRTVFLVGSDTGGHVVPVFALAQELEREEDIMVVVIGVGSEIEKKFYKDLKKTDYKIITAGKFQFSRISNVIAVIKSAIGFFQSIGLILKYQPKVIFLKGNYSTVPVAFAARMFSVPILAHESDAVIGKSNKLISRFAKKLFVSYPLEIYGRSDLEYSGPILRSEYSGKVVETSTRSEKPKILIIGGSQGAHAINELVFQSINELCSAYELTHQTGLKDIREAKEIKNKLPKALADNYKPQTFIENDYLVISSADLIISRASSGIFEYAAFKKPVVLVPYPYASLDHQNANAEFFKGRNAAVVLIEKDLTPTIFYSTISKLIASEKKRVELGASLHDSVKFGGEGVLKEQIIKMTGK